jgi:hypothetical protein
MSASVWRGCASVARAMNDSMISAAALALQWFEATAQNPQRT